MPASSAAATAELMPGTISNGNTGVRERERFFASTAKHERVAALEANDTLTAAGGSNHQPVDELLRDRMAPCAFSNVNTTSRRCQVEHRGIDQRVVKHEIRLGQTSFGPACQQIRIAGPRANERYRPRSERTIVREQTHRSPNRGASPPGRPIAVARGAPSPRSAPAGAPCAPRLSVRLAGSSKFAFRGGN